MLQKILRSRWRDAELETPAIIADRRGCIDRTATKELTT
jgi:hypothetical protein